MYLKNYVTSIITAAIVCAITKSFLNKNTATSRISNLLCGILMAVTIVTPICNISFSNIADFMDTISYDAGTYVEEGESLAKKEMTDIIKTQTEAYILDKANRMGLQISVEVELDDKRGNIPCGVTVTGKLSPYARAALGAYMEETLGIAKEKQKWS